MSSRIQPERLRQQLPPLGEAGDLGSEALHYQRFYGLDLARPGAIHSRLGRFRVHDYEIVAQAWWPREPHATLLVLHGYYDHMGLYRHVVRWGLEMGFAVLACDLPGHGLSSGPPAAINEFDEYQAVLFGLFEQARRLDLPRPWHLLGQSTGGAIALDHLLHQPTAAELGETILLAPLVRPRAWLRSRLSYQLLRPFVRQIRRTFTDNSGDADFLRFVQTRDPLQADILPTRWVGALARWIPRIEGAERSSQSPIIVQGEADMTVDWQHNLPVLQAKFTEPEILLLPEARHHLVNESDALRQRYFDFLRERLR
ncbi:phospholipase BipL [Stutzerimonas balearica]|jgi:alpha-beta hydrolase superfamily lysophospholipase|uniref:Alpha/beta hydrolase n=1 Tax=Stutzerimonas balearica TaxID=74829 RepID=A0A9X7V013_9GAMM|nr:alpha/beta hydrolase [Stutzerimonas balearica]MBZ5754270.1 alpha/beta hydrolase [Pseudomonas sp. S5(2021)]WIX02761.1 alpha/beta hydrolase [Pseudomonas sp. AR5]HCW94767.1 alpha/beta hydrolase [Pseudomonas sp.]MBK3750211.1 alpha/beta fold hydrolase [Stutzerimonas balearica]MBK3828407.1 alpha/beta fold hydrolase [Stutzerimonas balearica]